MADAKKTLKTYGWKYKVYKLTAYFAYALLNFDLIKQSSGPHLQKHGFAIKSN